jgi:regulator of replication initiation timing
MVEDLESTERAAAKQMRELTSQLDACREENRRLKRELEKLKKK